jgi:hypothetical protein
MSMAVKYQMMRKKKAHKPEPMPEPDTDTDDMRSPKERAMEAFHGKRMAEGGETGHEKGVHTHNYEGSGNSPAGSFSKSAVRGNTNIPKGDLNSYAKEEHKRVLGEMKSMPKPNLYADGGSVQSNAPSSGWSQKDKEDFSKGASEGSTTSASDAMNNISNSLGSLFEAEGGDAMRGEQSDDHEMDMVERIMRRRAKMMSEGGVVANEGEDELSHMADGKPNEFDDMALDDHLEFHDTGANSGDELGNEQLDHDEGDIVSRIMRSRAKKDRNPRPA